MRNCHLQGAFTGGSCMGKVGNSRDVFSGVLVVMPLLAALAAPLAVSSQAHAQGAVGPGAAAQGATIGSREVLLGTSSSPRNSTPALEREAQAYFDAAERERSLGRTDTAQRQLELLVARYPQTAIANVARHDLIALYGRATEAPQRQAELKASVATASADLGPKSHLGVPPQAADVPFALGSAEPMPNGWRTAVTPGVATGPAKRPTRTVQDTFRQAAGDLVFFSDGSAELGARARRVLEAQADWLKAQPTARVTVEGHADDSGSITENVKLSEARAKAVLARLVEAGIEPSRLSISAVGKTKRVADCDESACAAQNRRVATVIVAQSVAQAGDKATLASRSASHATNSSGRLPWENAPLPTPR
jgi:outer membrane protein OmpA-like peptidoglycan-associated protein